MNIVERLLTREEIDALELELARAREAPDEKEVSRISARIAQLETALKTARRGNSPAPSHSSAHPHAV